MIQFPLAVDIWTKWLDQPGQKSNKLNNATNASIVIKYENFVGFCPISIINTILSPYQKFGVYVPTYIIHDDHASVNHPHGFIFG